MWDCRNLNNFVSTFVSGLAAARQQPGNLLLLKVTVLRPNSGSGSGLHHNISDRHFVLRCDCEDGQGGELEMTRL